jgi:hypothetical protein
LAPTGDDANWQHQPISLRLGVSAFSPIARV